MAYRITFVVDLFKRGEQPLSDASLNVMLLALMAIDELYLKAHPETPLLYSSGVVYQEEPPGAEDWQDIPTCLKLRWGDCEDLACWRAAELRVRYGIAAVPFFTRQVKSDGSTLYHIMVRLPDGRTEDPSRQLGMR